MKVLNTKWLTVCMSSIVLLAVFRESGMVSIMFYWLNSSMSFSATTYREDPADGNAANVTLTISPRLNDYIPLYKQRTISGQAGLREPGCEIKMDYTIQVKVVGICSGHDFRELAKQRIIEKLQELAAE